MWDIFKVHFFSKLGGNDSGPFSFAIDENNILKIPLFLFQFCLLPPGLCGWRATPCKSTTALCWGARPQWHHRHPRLNRPHRLNRHPPQPLLRPRPQRSSHGAGEPRSCILRQEEVREKNVEFCCISAVRNSFPNIFFWKMLDMLHFLRMYPKFALNAFSPLPTIPKRCDNCLHHHEPIHMRPHFPPSFLSLPCLHKWVARWGILLLLLLFLPFRVGNKTRRRGRNSNE